VWVGVLLGPLVLNLAWSQQLPLAKLVTVFPPGATAGTTLTVTVTGPDLEEPTALRFSDPRLTATLLTNSPMCFSVSIPADVAPGWMDVRWVGRFGVSNPRGFAVSSRPELLSSDTNTSPAVAQELPLETVVNGRVAANQASWFRFVPRAGRRLVARVDARELDSRLEPILKVTNIEGRSLDQSRRGWIDFTPATDEPLLVAVHDTTYRGGDDFVYRLTVTAAPRLEFALPTVLRVGETNQVTLYGRNIPGGQTGKHTGADGKFLDEWVAEILAPPWGDGVAVAAEGLRKPAAAALASESFSWGLAATNGNSNSLLFTLTTNAVWTAVTNGLLEVIPPGEFNGLFPGRGERSGVTFTAKKGEVLWLELFSDRLGFTSDPRAVVQRVRGTKGEKGEKLFAEVLELVDTETNLGGNDFNTVTRDAAGRLEVPEDGTYQVLVRDLFNTGPGSPRWPYRLSLRRATPDVALVAVPVQPPRLNDNDRAVHTTTPFLRRGETQLIKVLAFRRDGFGGDIDLLTTNLPPGMTTVETRIPAGQNTGFVLLTAAEDAGPADGVGSIQILGRTADIPLRKATLATVARLATDVNEQAVLVRPVRESLMGVSTVESAPVTLVPTTNRFEVPVNGKLVVTLEVIRRGEFPAVLSLKPAGRAEWDKVKAASAAEKSTNATLEFDLTEAKLPEGTHTVWLQGTVAGKYRNNPEALTLAEAELKTAEQALATATAADKESLEKRKQEAEERRKVAEEKAKPRDVTLMVYSRPFVVIVVPVKPEAKP